jgi:hypothetical protein
MSGQGRTRVPFARTLTAVILGTGIASTTTGFFLNFGNFIEYEPLRTFATCASKRFTLAIARS